MKVVGGMGGGGGGKIDLEMEQFIQMKGRNCPIQVD